jgi:hypothetical protein
LELFYLFTHNLCTPGRISGFSKRSTSRNTASRKNHSDCKNFLDYNDEYNPGKGTAKKD